MSVRVLGWRSLKKADIVAADQQDTGGNSLWEWFSRYQPQEGQFLGFSNRRDRRAGVTFALYKAATTVIEDQARIRLVIYHPDQETQKVIILDETVATLKNASRNDIDNLITPSMTKILRPGDWLRLEANYSSIVDISSSDFEIGYLMMVR